MAVFGMYSRYYDLLYRDKDYAGEAAFVLDLIHRHQNGARSLLELGCGSGNHAARFSEHGLQVTGVEQSAEMLPAAALRRSKLPADVAERLAFSEGDIRSLRLDQTFDCAISLFHGISYMPDNAALLAALTTARAHLAPGGSFIFDVWYGPAVLSDRPAVRIKRMQDDNTEVTRLAEPVLHPNECIVDVNYSVFIRDRHSAAVEEIRETHHMRYLFQPELALAAAASGFKIEHAAEWMTDAEPSDKTWGVYFVMRAV